MNTLDPRLVRRKLKAVSDLYDFYRELARLEFKDKPVRNAAKDFTDSRKARAREWRAECESPPDQ